MTDPTKARHAVLPADMDVPSIDELKKKLFARLATLRGNLCHPMDQLPLSFSKKSKVNALAEAGYKRRLAKVGLGAVKREALPALLKLARSGGALLGPSTEDEVYELAASLHAESPWMRDVSAWIMKQMLIHVATGGHGLTLPPVILAGPPGIGKSHYARSLAGLVNAPVRLIDVGGGSAGFRISGTEKGWATEQPGIPVETVFASSVANPIMVVDEIDKAGSVHGTRGSSTSITTSLLQMIEPSTARHFECPCHRVPFDLSRIVWIMTANDVDCIPAPLRDRSRLFLLPKLSAEDATAYFDRMSPHDPEGAEHERCRAFIARMAELPHGISLRQIQHLSNALITPASLELH